jgi:hypothetical protein
LFEIRTIIAYKRAVEDENIKFSEDDITEVVIKKTGRFDHLPVTIL